MGRIFKTLFYNSFWSLYKALGFKKSTTIFLTWILHPSYICIKNRKGLSKNFRYIKLALFFLFLAFTFLCSKIKGKLCYCRDSVFPFLIFAQSLSHVQPFVSRGAHQAPLCMEFPRQEYWSGLPFTSSGHLPNPGLKAASPVSPTLADNFFFYHWATWETFSYKVLNLFSCLI